MWLLRLFPWISRAAAFVYYRIRYTGDRVPAAGPVLLVANHPNSLLDPMLVGAAARRPVRFLAKAPLFDDRTIAWLVRASGAIPVYRRADDPTQMDRNLDAFRAVHAALAEGAAVGIFPEGLSHSEPALAPLKTGAARIALGAAMRTGGPFPLVPIGLDFRQKDRFRSRAVVLTGRPIPWDDLAGRDVNDAEAVRALTERIADGLAHLTVNLERWQDRPLVECAVQIWEAERAVPPDPAERVARLVASTHILGEVRRTGDQVAGELAADVETHRRRLRRFRLRPVDLASPVWFSTGVRWAARRVFLVFPLAAVIALVGFLLFFPPYRLTGFLVDRLRRPDDQRSTYKLLTGIVVYGVWLAALTAAAAVAWGVVPGLAVLLGMPVVGMVGLTVRERWRGAWSDARRFLLLRSRRALVDTLRAHQRDLAARLQGVYQQYYERGPPTPPASEEPA